MVIDVTEAKYKPKFKLDIAFSDGTRQLVDFGPFLKKAQNPMLTKYRELDLFKSFKIEDGNLMWGDYEMLFPVWDLHEGDI